MEHVHEHYIAILVLCYLYFANCQLHVENVALNGTCSMTTTFPDTGDCTEAIDNVTDLELRFTNNEGIANCIHTINTNPAGCSPFWQLVLKEEFTITNITIYNRAGYQRRLENTDVTVNGAVCKSFGSDVSSIVQNDVATFQCSPPIRGTTVKISRNSDCSDDGEFTLNLCEVQVWVCGKGWYGNDCNTPCSGHCSNNATCDRYNGSCPGDCINGWYGSRCDNSCQNCVGACVQSSGICSECKSTHYGQMCQEECGQCFGQEACNKDNGNCSKCEPGLELPQCKNECNGRFYGQDCREECGHCFNEEICNKKTGSCSACKPGWMPPLCKDVAEVKNSSTQDGTVGIIVGSVVGAVVVIVAVVLFIAVYRRRRKSHTDDSNGRLHSDNTSQNTTNIAYTESNFKSSVASHDSKELIDSSKRSTVNLQNNQPLSSSGVVAHQSKDRKSHKPITIVNPRESAAQQKGSINQMYENVSAVNKTAKNGESTGSPNVKQEDTKVPMDVYDDDTDDVYNTESIYSTYRPLVVWDEFQQSILSSLASGTLSVHFKNLKKGLIHPHTEGMKPENMRKNRFKSILPYDDNRVILQRSKAEKDSDYINASYVKGYMKENAYIATQGPRAHTVNDFWLMIWQRNTAQIIMLTNVIENGKNKCDEYWPDRGTSRTYGNTVVTCLSEELRADFIARNFSLTLKGNPAERPVQHYHYVAWPDHGVPSATSLVDFWRYVRARALPLSLPVVHCSAGVGRTGTYIALDIAMDLVADGRDVNVLKIVTDLREDRIDMVQAEAQYKFLYEVIFEAYTSRNSRLTREEFDERFHRPINVKSSNTVIDNEFKILQLMGEFVPKRECNMSSKQENIVKCRNTSALPADNHLVSLKGNNRRNTYINAVRVPSFKHRNGMLLTQLPLPDTLLDFWCLVDESDVTTIVSLSYKDESKIVKNHCQYWPKTSDMVLTVDQYVIKLITSTVLGHHLTTYTVTHGDKENVRTVHILHFTDWSVEVPGDPNDVIQLVESLNTYHSEREESTVLVQCIDGAAKSGLFCVMREIIDRVTYDHVIDVFLSVRHVKAFRPQAITNEDEYRFCYKLAQAAKQHLGVYENM